jgi:hypothetical protein
MVEQPHGAPRFWLTSVKRLALERVPVREEANDRGKATDRARSVAFGGLGTLLVSDGPDVNPLPIHTVPTRRGVPALVIVTVPVDPPVAVSERRATDWRPSTTTIRIGRGSGNRNRLRDAGHGKPFGSFSLSRRVAWCARSQCQRNGQYSSQQNQCYHMSYSQRHTCPFPVSFIDTAVSFCLSQLQKSPTASDHRSRTSHFTARRYPPRATL